MERDEFGGEDEGLGLGDFSAVPAPYYIANPAQVPAAPTWGIPFIDAYMNQTAPGYYVTRPGYANPNNALPPRPPTPAPSRYLLYGALALGAFLMLKGRR